MALSGSNYVSVGAHWRLSLEWSATQSELNNTSTVTANLYWESLDSYGTVNSSATKSGYIKIDGTTYSFSGDGLASLSGKQKKLLKSATKVVNHNTDGTKSISISGNFGMEVALSDVYYSSKTVSLTANLTDIPRASSISSISGNTIGKPVTISISRASDAFTHTVKYKKTDGTTVTLATGIATSHTFTPALTDANLLPNSTSGTASIIVDTYKGGSKIGTTTKAFTIYVPTDIVPIINTVSIDEAVTGIKEKFSAYVKTKSKLNIEMTAVGAYGSTITVHKMTANGTSYSSSSAVTDILKTSGTNRITFEVWDSRGRKASVAREITVLDYFNPFISTLSATRSNSDGTINNEGTHAKISYLAGISPVNNKNDKSFIIRYRVNGTETWTEIDITGTDYTVSESSLVLPNFNPDYSYDIELVVSDYFTSIPKRTALSVGFSLVNYHPDGKSLAFGKVSSGKGLEIALENTFERAPTIIAPTTTDADGALFRLKRKDGTLLAFIATGTGGQGLKIHLYDGVSWSGYIEIRNDGSIVNESPKLANLLNGWVNFSEVNGTYAQCHYWKDKNGVVHINGMIKGGLTANETPIFNLPVGYRPKSREIYTVNSSGSFARIDALPNGNVVTSGVISSGWVSLAGISFTAEN